MLSGRSLIHPNLYLFHEKKNIQDMIANPLLNKEGQATRRAFTGQILAGSLAAGMLPEIQAASDTPPVQGKAEACILLWMGGGMCHLDTFDPKQLGDPPHNKPGSAYPSISTAIPGVEVCQHLSQTAPLFDRGVILRSVHHPLSVDHADASNFVKTGRVTDGTILYPSLGSIISHQLGPRVPDIPAYVVMGMPNITRGPGFLGAKYGYVYLTDTSSGPSGLKPPLDVGTERAKERARLLDRLRNEYVSHGSPDAIQDYDSTISKAYQLMHGDFAKVFNLEKEKQSLREDYGNDFGERCLIARRLVESGARFVEASFNLNFVNGTGWDTHREGQLKQHLLIQGLDKALSTLIRDLEKRKLLDKTLVIVGTEFGRPAEFDNKQGRGHQSTAFSFAFFGGGLRTGQSIGVTDSLGKKILERPVSIPDLHATILAALGIDPQEELFAGARPVPITDHGTPVKELFS